MPIDFVMEAIYRKWAVHLWALLLLDLRFSTTAKGEKSQALIKLVLYFITLLVNYV